VNNPQARFCQACGETLEIQEDKPVEDVVETKKPEKKARRRLPGWARVVLTTLVVVIVAAALGLGFAFVSPYINAYMTYSPARLERAGLLAQEFVDQVYPAFADAEPDVWVETIDGQEVYVVDFLAQDGDNSLGLRLLVNKNITAVRTLEYVELGPPEPFGDAVTVDAGEGEPVQPVLSEGIAEILQDPEIVRYEDFSNLDETRWWTVGDVELTSAGEVEIRQSPTNVSRLGSIQELTGGDGLLLSLRFEAGSEFEVSLSKGEWSESSFLRAGLWYVDGALETSIYLEGPVRIDNQALEGLSLVPGRWYGVLGAVEGDGSLLFVIWDEDDPSQSVAFLKDFGDQAAGSSWAMHVGLASGTVTMDNYYELDFEGFR
jgi:hypothetical protein